MAGKMVRGLAIAAVVALVLGGLLWLIPVHDRGANEPSTDDGTGVALLPSDGGTDQPPQTDEPTATVPEDVPAPTGDHTDPEQVASEFMDAYPGNVQSLADPTFLASLDGVAATPLEEVTNMSLEQADHSFDEVYEQYAYTVSGTYQSQQVQVYSIVVARPAEPGEGGTRRRSTCRSRCTPSTGRSACSGTRTAPAPQRASSLRSPPSSAAT